MEANEVFARLPPLPESAQVVLRHLLGHPPMTGKDLREQTGLPRRTVYTALQKLRQLGMIVEKASLRDTRQTYFSVPAQWVPGRAQQDAHAPVHG